MSHIPPPTHTRLRSALVLTGEEADDSAAPLSSGPPLGDRLSGSASSVRRLLGRVISGRQVTSQPVPGVSSSDADIVQRDAGAEKKVIRLNRKNKVTSLAYHPQRINCLACAALGGGEYYPLQLAYFPMAQKRRQI